VIEVAIEVKIATSLREAKVGRAHCGRVTFSIAQQGTRRRHEHGIEAARDEPTRCRSDQLRVKPRSSSADVAALEHSSPRTTQQGVALEAELVVAPAEQFFRD
jgi:hypothetical protein